ncbi:MAG: VWA domain-containing protein, partial [Chloroflexi bacterium]|nr:VWA domain-containing protein [Chloroflexota bacterium]
AAVSLNRPSAPFRAFRDLAYDSRGNLRVLTADGEVQTFDARGRDAEPIQLAGLRGRALEALAAGFDENGVTLFTLSADGWAFKHDAAGRMLAAWELEAEAGPGRYRDLTVDGLGRVLIPDGDANRILVFDRLPTQPSEAPPDPRGEACRITTSKGATPGRLALGETTEVRLSLAADCGPAWDALDVVLSIDQSCQMGGERLAAARAAGNALIDALRVEADRLALVGFNDEADGARLLVPLTDDKQALREALASLSTECLPPIFYPERRYDARNAAGLRAGGEALFGPAGRPAAGKVLVLVSASSIDREQAERLFGRSLPGSLAAPVSDREHALWEAWRLWARGARIYSVGVGLPAQRLGMPAPPAPDLQSSQPPDEGLLAALANPPSGYRKAESPADLAGIANDIGLTLSDRRLFQSLVITDRVPINMRLLPGSISPPATLIPDPDPASSALLRWDLGPVALGAAPPSLSYLLEPLQSGRHPTNVEALASYTDGLDYAGRARFPVPEVEVIGATETPSPSPSPEASATPRDTGTSTPTGTLPPSPTRPSATPRPTGPPRPIHLPILFREQCVPKARPVDVALVIDTSSSMNGAKLAAARSAGRSFVALLDPSRDRASIVGFDNEARLAQPLTGDQAALGRALDGLATAVGTRIDLGLWTALGELTGANRRAEADRVIVLLTDGRPQLGTEPAMRAAAQLARDVGVATYVIGLGEDVLPEVLREIAGAESRVYLAPDGAALSAIYRDIARLIPCR